MAVKLAAAPTHRFQVLEYYSIFSFSISIIDILLTIKFYSFIFMLMMFSSLEHEQLFERKLSYKNFIIKI